MRLNYLHVALFALFPTLAIPAARADILISINRSVQQMTVTVDGSPRYVWPVSTGAPGYDTPSGNFKPFRMERDHFSREWDEAPMPYSIFFTKQGHAIHGSNHVKAIGTPASHGCVRLEPRNASILFALVEREGMGRTHVVLTGETPGGNNLLVRRGRGSYGLFADDYITSPAPVWHEQRDARGWREYRGDSRPYYYRGEPYYGDRYYRSRGVFPFGQ